MEHKTKKQTLFHVEHKTKAMKYAKIIKPTDLIRVITAIQENTNLRLSEKACRDRLFVIFEGEEISDFVMLGRILESEKL